MMRTGPELTGRQNFNPGRIISRILGGTDRLDPAGRRVIAGKVRGIDIKTDNPSPGGKRNHSHIMPAIATTNGFPAVHPLTIIVILIRQKDSIGILQHTFQRGKELICRPDRTRPQPGRGQIDTVMNKGGGGCICRCHLWSCSQSGKMSRRRSSVMRSTCRQASENSLS